LYRLSFTLWGSWEDSLFSWQDVNRYGFAFIEPRSTTSPDEDDVSELFSDLSYVLDSLFSADEVTFVNRGEQLSTLSVGAEGSEFSVMPTKQTRKDFFEDGAQFTLVDEDRIPPV
jgi:hypothetical protein